MLRNPRFEKRAIANYILAHDVSSFRYIESNNNNPNNNANNNYAIMNYESDNADINNNKINLLRQEDPWSPPHSSPNLGTSGVHKAPIPPNFKPVAPVPPGSVIPTTVTPANESISKLSIKTPENQDYINIKSLRSSYANYVPSMQNNSLPLRIPSSGASLLDIFADHTDLSYTDFEERISNLLQADKIYIKSLLPVLLNRTDNLSRGQIGLAKYKISKNLVLHLSLWFNPIVSESKHDIHAWHLSEIFAITKNKWFHGFCTAKEASDKLKDRPEGTFLMRFSSQPPQYALDVKDQDGVKHWRIEQRGKNCYILSAGTKAKEYKSLPHLVQVHSHESLAEFMGSERSFLKSPCSRKGYDETWKEFKALYATSKFRTSDDPIMDDFISPHIFKRHMTDIKLTWAD